MLTKIAFGLEDLDIESAAVGGITFAEDMLGQERLLELGVCMIQDIFYGQDKQSQ